MVSKLYYKNKLIIKLIKPFENKRLFSPLKLNIFTLRDYKLWPEKLIALDAFCQTGLQWTRVFSQEAYHLEMWDIDPDATKYAKKEFPNAVVTCGDSIDALMNRKFSRKDFNFVLIDSPLPYIYEDGTFEHFKFFDSIFGNIANEAVIMLDVVPDIQTMLNLHPQPQDFVNKWVNARNQFYGVTNGGVVLPGDMTEIYRKKVELLGYKIKYIAYNARNEHFGLLTMAVSKLR